MMSISIFLAMTFFVSMLSSTFGLFYRDVTSRNFDKLLDPTEASILIEFYAPWCGHCKNLAPEYERLGTTFEKTNDVVIAQVDADKHKKLARRFNVGGFPTLKWVQKGSSFDDIEDVNAGRTAAELLAFVNDKTGLLKKLKDEAESSVVVLSPENFDSNALRKKKRAFVGFFAPWCGHCKALKPTWEKLAALYADDEDIIIGSVDCDAHAEYAEKYGVQGFPTLKYFELDEPEDYSGGRDLDSLVKFLNEKTGAEIASDGGVTPSAGVINQLSDHIKTYVEAATPEERTKVVDTCHQAVEGLDERARGNFKYYAKVFAKIAEKGAEYVKGEKERLLKILESSESLKGSQKKNFMRRVNVLNEFSEL